jgi:hypothetical protein
VNNYHNSIPLDFDRMDRIRAATHNEMAITINPQCITPAKLTKAQNRFNAQTSFKRIALRLLAMIEGMNPITAIRITVADIKAVFIKELIRLT